MEYEEFIIKKFNYWTLFLHSNQCYLGRTYLWANRDSAKDFLEITEEEKAEFFVISKKLKLAINNLFSPDLFNYASLGNICSHLHIHIIPRYQEFREFMGCTFYDEQWGKNYSPYNYNVKTNETILSGIKNKILLKINEEE